MRNMRAALAAPKMLVPAILAVAFLALARPATADEARVLDAAQVAGLMSGNTLVAETQLERFRDRPERVFHVYLRGNGTLVIRRFNGRTDDGWWKVTADGLYCSRYRQTRMGMERCYRVENIGGDRFRLVDTSKETVTAVFTVAPGNPLGL